MKDEKKPKPKRSHHKKKIDNEPRMFPEPKESALNEGLEVLEENLASAISDESKSQEKMLNAGAERVRLERIIRELKLCRPKPAKPIVEAKEEKKAEDAAKEKKEDK